MIKAIIHNAQHSLFSQALASKLHVCNVNTPKFRFPLRLYVSKHYSADRLRFCTALCALHAFRVLQQDGKLPGARVIIIFDKFSNHFFLSLTVSNAKELCHFRSLLPRVKKFYLLPARRSDHKALCHYDFLSNLSNFSNISCFSQFDFRHSITSLSNALFLPSQDFLASLLFIILYEQPSKAVSNLHMPL